MSEFKFTSGDVLVDFDRETKTVLITQRDARGKRAVLRIPLDQFQNFMADLMLYSQETFGLTTTATTLRGEDVTGGVGYWAKLSESSETEVNLYIPGDVSLRDQEEIIGTVGDFMEALGFEMKAQEEPVYNSLWQRIKFVLKKNVTSQDFDRLFKKGKQALEKKYVDLPIAEETEKLANAAEKINNMFEKFPNAAVRLGSLVYIKQTINGVPHAIVHQLSSDQVYQLDTKPALIKDMESLKELIENPPRIAVAGAAPQNQTELPDTDNPDSNQRI